MAGAGDGSTGRVLGSDEMLGFLLVACEPEAAPPPTDVADGTDVPTPDPHTGHSATAGTADTAPPEEPPEATVTVTDAPYMVLEKRFAIVLSRDTPTTLQCTSPQDPLEDHRLVTSGATVDLALHGLLAASTYECALWWPRVGETSLWAGQLTTGVLPEELPEFVISGDAGRAALDEGYVLMSHWWQGRSRTQRLVVADGQGRVRWYLTLPEAKAGVTGEWLGDALVVGGGETEPPSLRSLSGVISFEGPAAQVPDAGWHHEALRTPEGWVLGMEGVRDPGGFVGFMVQAFDPATGAQMWAFDSRDHASELEGPTGPNDTDPYHANAVSWVDDVWGPAVWISIRAQERLVRVDRRTGDVTHVVGPEAGGWTLVDTAGAVLPAGRWFWQQHDPEITGDRLVVFDNGASRPGGVISTRLTQYRLVDDDTLELVWSWTEPGWFEPNMGSVQTLPNGHVVVGSAHDIDHPDAGGLTRVGFVAEIDGPAGEVVWRMDFDDPKHSLYRAQALDGCGIFANVRTCPSLAD